MPNPAAVAYESYRTYMNEHGNSGTYLCPWSYLPSVEKSAWFAVVAALAQSIAGQKEQTEGSC